MRVMVSALVIAGLTGPLAAQEDVSSFGECDARVRGEPDEPDSYSCYYDAANLASDMAGAERRLEALFALRPEQHWALYYLGVVVAEQRDYDRGLSLIVEAAEGMEADGMSRGAATARIMLALHLTNLRRYDEAVAQLDLAQPFVEKTDDTGLRARLLVQRGWTALRSGDYTRAALHMRRAESLVFPDGDPAIQQEVLGGRGAVAWLTGRFAEAARIYEQQAALHSEAGNVFKLAATKGNVLGVTSALADRGKVGMDEYERVAREALAAAEAANRLKSISRAQSALAKILPGEEGLALAHAAVRTARETGDPRWLRGTLREAAALQALAGPDKLGEALSLLDEAEPPPHGNPDERIRHLKLAASVWRRAGTRDQTVYAYEQLFDEAERLRDLQRDDEARAGALALVVHHYRQLASYLMALESVPSREDLELAFRTLERMRSRVLLDRLDASGVIGTPALQGPLAERRLRLLDEIARVQRGLAARDTTAQQRADLLGRLGQLETEEREARMGLAEVDPRFGALRLPDFPDMAEIQEILADDQALLSFHVGNAALGGSWVQVIQRRGVRTVQLPAVEHLRRQAAFLVGLIERRDGSEREAATRLGDELLGAAIEELDPGISRLILVPDDVLWNIPFDLLGNSGQDSRCLAERFEISLTPSATLWKRWVTSEPDAVRAPALALADPDLAGGGDDGNASTLRSWATARGMTLGSLPHARGEARALTRRLGGGSRLWLGGEASESALKREKLKDYGLLHFAVHAVVDDEHPDRSAVVLAAGSEVEDGLLQPREIVELDLRGQAVVLTACRSASGSVLDGEGPLSLARAFFQAGAHAVVGSLWPLRDDDAARLMGAFSRRLARGASVAGALAAARREMIAAGAPPEAWAGLVLIGDGSVVPVPGGRSRHAGWWIAGLAAAVIVAWAAVRAFRKNR